MADSMEAVRAEAKAQFRRSGLPHDGLEDWKYTDVSQITQLMGNSWRQPSDVVEPDSSALDASIASAAMDGIDGYLLVFSHGHLQRGGDDLPEGITIHSSCTSIPAMAPDAALFHAFDALNAANMQDGLLIDIAEGVQLDRAIYVLNIHHDGLHTHVRHQVSLGKDASATLIAHDVSPEHANAAQLHTFHWNFALEKNADLQFIRLQSLSANCWQVGRLEVSQQQNSHFHAHAIELGGGLVRLDLLASLQEEDAQCELNGLYLLDQHQHVDQHLHVDHLAPNCTSRQRHRSVLNGRSHGVYNSQVHVHVGASGTDAKQYSDNLLLSKTAEIDTKPELEIDHDDVKCAHGATVGQLNKDQLFYLQTRGLSEEMSREVLVFAFADSILAHLPDEQVRKHIEQIAFEKLPHEVDIDGLLG